MPSVDTSTLVSPASSLPPFAAGLRRALCTMSSLSPNTSQGRVGLPASSGPLGGLSAMFILDCLRVGGILSAVWKIFRNTYQDREKKTTEGRMEWGEEGRQREKGTRERGDEKKGRARTEGKRKEEEEGDPQGPVGKVHTWRAGWAHGNQRPKHLIRKRRLQRGPPWNIPVTMKYHVAASPLQRSRRLPLTLSS